MSEVHCDWCGNDWDAGDVLTFDMPNSKFICENCVQDELNQLNGWIKDYAVALNKIHRLEVVHPEWNDGQLLSEAVNIASRALHGNVLPQIH